jgi:hypothetical protein
VPANPALHLTLRAGELFVRRQPSSDMRMKLHWLVAALVVGACGESGGAGALPDVAEPYRGPAASAPTNQLQVIASAVHEVVTDPDSVLIRFRVRNDGPSTEFRNAIDFFYFMTHRADASRVPRTTINDHGMGGGASWRPFASGAQTPERTVNLACFRSTERPQAPCEGIRLREAGDYYVVVQHAPVRPPEGPDRDAPMFRPSRADTVLIRFRPTG